MVSKNAPTVESTKEYKINNFFIDLVITNITSKPEQNRSTKLTRSPEKRVDVRIKIENTPELMAIEPLLTVAIPTRMQNVKSPLLARKAPEIKSPYGQENRDGKKPRWINSRNKINIIVSSEINVAKQNALKTRLSTLNKKQLAKAKSGNLIQIKASPNEYSRLSESSADTIEKPQKANNARTQLLESQNHWRFVIDQPKKDNPQIVNQTSAGVRSIKRKKGPNRKKPKLNRTVKVFSIMKDFRSSMTVLKRKRGLRVMLSCIFKSYSIAH